MRKLLFNYSFYSHPEIGNFRGEQKRESVLVSKRKKQLVRTADALLRATSIKRCLKTPERHKSVLTKQVINLKLDQITSE
jgi:hypothetical protein